MEVYLGGFLFLGRDFAVSLVLSTAVDVTRFRWTPFSDDLLPVGGGRRRRVKNAFRLQKREIQKWRPARLRHLRIFVDVVWPVCHGHRQRDIVLTSISDSDLGRVVISSHLPSRRLSGKESAGTPSGPIQRSVDYNVKSNYVIDFEHVETIGSIYRRCIR